MNGDPPSARHALALVVAAAAITGVLGGLARIGVPAGWGSSYASDHGPLLVLGVFGTVVALERALALGARWAFAAPVASAAATVAMLGGWPVAPWVAAASSGGLLATNLAAVARRPTQFACLLLAGSALLLLGNLRWAAGDPVFRVVPAWMGFFVLTIVAERRRLSRHVHVSQGAVFLLAATVSILVVALVARVGGVLPAIRVMGAAMMGLAIWQLRYDAARQTIRQAGLPRFMAVGALAGMVWLLAAGGLLGLRALPPAGPMYDAAVHAVFVGYVLSTAFAHGLDVLPAIAGVRIPFAPLLYGPLALLHASLVCRVLGDVTNQLLLRQIGSAGNALAIGLFAAVIVSTSLRRPRSPR